MFVKRIDLCMSKEVCGAFKKRLKTVNECNTMWEMFPEGHRNRLLQVVSVWPNNKWLQSDIKNIQSMIENSTNNRAVHVKLKHKVPIYTASSVIITPR